MNRWENEKNSYLLFSVPKIYPYIMLYDGTMKRTKSRRIYMKYTKSEARIINNMITIAGEIKKICSDSVLGYPGTSDR